MTDTSGNPREDSKIPNFELPDQEPLPYDLYQTLQKGPLILVFYRGDR